MCSRRMTGQLWHSVGVFSPSLPVASSTDSFNND